MTLPAGTKITMRYAYDNSAENVRNPNHPPVRVMAGNRASDEMAHLWLQVLPSDSATAAEAAGDPRALIQEAMARHHLEKNPEDFEAHYNLAALLQARGDVAGAYPQFWRLCDCDRTMRRRTMVWARRCWRRGAGAGDSIFAGGARRRDRIILTRTTTWGMRWPRAEISRGHWRNFARRCGCIRRMRMRKPIWAARWRKRESRKRRGEHFERALKLNPNHQLARENLRALEQDGAE